MAAVVARARAAQPGWEALGFDGRAKVLRRAQKWVIDNADRISRTIVAENGKAYEDAQLAEVSYAAGAFGFWAKSAPKYLADERVRSSSPFVIGRKLLVRYEPVGVAGVIGPWNYPLTNSFGDCIPALAAGNSAVLKPASLTPLTSLLMAEGLRECGLPEDVFIVAPGGGSVGEALIDEVDFVMFTGSTEVGKKVMARAAQHAHPGGPRAGRQGPDDRAVRRQPRARRQRGGPLLDAERRADLHLGRARVRGGAGVRRVRGQGGGEAERPAPGPVRATPGRWTSARSPRRRRWT